MLQFTLKLLTEGFISSKFAMTRGQNRRFRVKTPHLCVASQRLCRFVLADRTAQPPHNPRPMLPT